MVNVGVDIVHDGSSPAFSTVLLDGFCCRYKLLRQGRRQILAFQIPGDLLDLYSYVLPNGPRDRGPDPMHRGSNAPYRNSQELRNDFQILSMFFGGTLLSIVPLFALGSLG